MSNGTDDEGPSFVDLVEEAQREVGVSVGSDKPLDAEREPLSTVPLQNAEQLIEFQSKSDHFLEFNHFSMGSNSPIIGDLDFSPVFETGEQMQHSPSSSDRAEALAGPRFLKFDIFDVDENRALDVQEGLSPDCTYLLHVDVSGSQDCRYEPGLQPTLDVSQAQEEELQVAVVPRRGRVNVLQQVDFLRLGPNKESNPARFVIEVSAEAVAGEDIEIDIYIHASCDLVAAATLSAEVQIPGRTWKRTIPIRWNDTTSRDNRSRSRPFQRWNRATAEDGRRSACIAVQPAGGRDEYVVTILFGRAELPLRVRFSRGELESNLLRVRSLLDGLRRDALFLDGGFDEHGEYTGNYDARSACFRGDGSRIELVRLRKRVSDFMTQIAIVGSSLRASLFSDEAGQTVLQALVSHIPDAGVVQIWLDRRALDFNYPWAWMYDQPFDPAYRTTIETKHFWGYRWTLEQVADCLDPPLQPPKSSVIPNDRGFKAHVGVYDFVQTKNQRAFFEALVQRSAAQINVEIWSEDRSWERHLCACDDELLYFFCHGHTAIPMTDGRLAVTEFGENLQHLLDVVSEKEVETERVKAARNRLEAALQRLRGEGMEGEHHIRLTNGYIRMGDLNTLRLCGSNAPLVFLNMCESAQVFPSLSTGLVNVFLRKGAAGVIGTEMPMIPEFADLYARLFLEEFFHGRDVGDIMLRLRRKFLDAKNPLAFAYTHFGNAFTRTSPPLLKGH